MSRSFGSEMLAVLLGLAKVPESTNDFNSFHTDFNHACRTGPSGIFSISCMERGAGSHDNASFLDGKVVIASEAHASTRSKLDSLALSAQS